MASSRILSQAPLPVDGGMRVGLAPYNDRGDVDRLLDGLADFF